MLAALLAGLAAASCGDVRILYTNQQCPDDPPAVVVEFVSAGNRRAVAVEASGSLRDGPFVEEMRASAQQPGAVGRTHALAGGFGREGVYDVRVQTRAGEAFAWDRIKVDGDFCGPLTVVLQAEISARAAN
jgi:hypothetical protein